MLTINNKEYRNLEEQVLKNKEDIAKHYEIDRTLSNFGIKIVGTVATVNDLPNPLYYEGEYGDGYAVGQPGSYTYYIFTRPDPNAGIYENHWLDVGQLAIQGPQGPVGPQGPRGETGQSTKWFTDQLTADDNAKPGDLLLERNGSVYKKSTEGNLWKFVTNIMGPQGIQGPRGIQGEQGPQGAKGERGETGDVGAFIHINGILSSSSQLPFPTQINDLSAAYLIGANEPYTLWIQAGTSVQTAIWTDVGELNVGTYITVNGQFQNIWNADTKLDKNTSVTRFNQLYAKAADGGEVYIDVTKQGLGDTVVQRESDGSITLLNTPANPYQVTNKKYVDKGLDGKVDKVADRYRIYGTDASGNQIAYKLTSSAKTGFQIPIYDDTHGKAVLRTNTPQGDLDCANKKYVDDRLQQLKNEILSQI